MKALVLSGGASKGPFHVGFCRRTIGELGTHYGILSGVSYGALVAGFLAMYREGDEEEAARDLEDLFLPIEDGDVHRRWFPWGRIAALWKSSLLDSSPLAALVEERFDPVRARASGKSLRIGAVSLTSGMYQIFDQDHVPLKKAILASAAFPGFFCPVRMGGQLWIDGGVQRVTPIAAAIAAGATAIDVVITETREPSLEFDSEPKTLDVLLRSLELMVARLTWVDVEAATRVNELVRAGAGGPGKRHVEIRVAAPDVPLNKDPLRFDPVEAAAIAEGGYTAALALEEDLEEPPNGGNGAPK